MTPLSLSTNLNLVAAATALTIALGLPAETYRSGRRTESGVLAVEAKIIAKSVSDFIGNAPQNWEFQAERLDDRIRNLALPDRRVELLGPTGKTLAAVSVDVAAPTFTARAIVYDFGVPVATVVVTSSQRPLLVDTFRWGLATLLIAGIVYFPLRRIPLRALRLAQDETERIN